MTELLSIERIRQYIENDVQENLHLEYKASASLKGNIKLEELTKDVSAFANADGGTIIFGVIEGSKERKHFPEDLDEGFERSGKVNAIWLEDVLLGNIAPKIQGLKPYEIELENGNFILVLEVPQSQYGPHMAKGNRYYKRRQTKAEPMEHYEVEDVRNRSRGPLLQLNIDFKNVEYKQYKDFELDKPYPIYLEIENLVQQPAEYAAVNFYLELSLFSQYAYREKEDRFEIVKEPVISDELNYQFENQKRFIRYKTMIGLPHSSPVFKGNPVNLPGVYFKLPKHSNSYRDDYDFGWEIISPFMTTQVQFYKLNVNRENISTAYIEYKRQ